MILSSVECARQILVASARQVLAGSCRKRFGHWPTSMQIETTLIISLCLVQVAYCLWPSPWKFEYGVTVCVLGHDVSLTYEPQQQQYWRQLQQVLGLYVRVGHKPENDDYGRGLIDAAYLRFQEDVRSHSFVPWKFRSKEANHEPVVDENAIALSSIVIEHGNSLLDSSSLEAYSLRISGSCGVTIRINHPLGAVRAMTTLTQMFYRHTDQNDVAYINNAPVDIFDAPEFEHRGLNLDISRNIISPDDVMRTIDALAFCKFNRLHLHASDAQSWPLEISSLPELATKGAYHKSQIWRVADLQQVEQFGADRGIEVYVEIEMPGHTASIQKSYPELITSFNRKPWEEYSAQPPSGQLDLNSDAVYDFVETLLSDLLPRTKPFSPLFHLGGDEVTAAAYNMTEVELKPFLQAFMDHAIAVVQGHGLAPVVWEEHILDYNLSLPANTIVQAWRGPTQDRPRSSLEQLVSRGHRALFGSNDYWYLDCGHGSWIDPSRDNPESWLKSPYLDYCSPYKNWRHILSYDPLADIPQSQQHLVVGGEVHLWGELTDGENLDSMLWPRAAAAAEVLWRGRGIVEEDSTRRLAEVREWLTAKGIAAGPVQVTWCLMNPGNCVAT